MAESRDARLHPARLARCLDAMRERDIDALVLSRAANVRYASGARRIYSAGTRPFAPACVVTADGEVHVLGIGDAGVPAHVPAANRHRARWQATDVGATVARILGGGRLRVGVDGMSVGQRPVLEAALPGAVWADADAAMRAARAVKTAAELEVLAEADRFAGEVSGILLREFEAGVAETGLRATAAAAVAGVGAVLAVSPRLDLRDGLCTEVCLLVDGYAGEAVVVAPADRSAAAAAALARLQARVRDGVECESLPDDGAAAIGVHGLGLGVEPPLAGAGWESGGSGGRLVAGMVLRLRAAAGGVVAAQTVVVGDSGCAPLPGREQVEAGRAATRW